MQDNLQGAGNGAQPSAANIKNTNKWDTRQLVVMALMCAISVLLSFVEFPIWPAAPWLKYDASFVPVMVVGFAYGAGPGLAIGYVAVALHGLMAGDFWGAVMNIIAVTAFVLPAALMYKRSRTMKTAIIGLVVSSLCAIVFAIIGNILVTPIYAGMPVEAVIAMIIPILIPFNCIKVVLNSVITLAVYKVISNLITPKKKQVKGR